MNFEKNSIYVLDNLNNFFRYNKRVEVIHKT